MQRVIPSKRVYDTDKDEISIRNIIEHENGKEIRRVSIGQYIYALDDILGNGYSGVVYKGHVKSAPKQKYAIKVIDLKKFKKDSSLALLDMEVEIVMSLNHPNIIQCLDVFKSKSFYYLVFEYCPHGDLQQLIKFQKAIPEDRAILIMKQVLAGYKVLMAKNIIHRDLKPANIMRFGNKWKIGDFGFARYCKDQYVLDKIHVGTPLYLAPQSLQMSKYSFRGDLFALGVIFYEMLVGQTPWQGKNQKQLLFKMKQCQSPPIPETVISQQIKIFLKRTLEKEFYDRMSKDQFKKFSLDNIDIDNLVKLRPPKRISPLPRSISKSNGKPFLLVPIKASEDEKKSPSAGKKQVSPMPKHTTSARIIKRQQPPQQKHKEQQQQQEQQTMKPSSLKIKIPSKQTQKQQEQPPQQEQPEHIYNKSSHLASVSATSQQQEASSPLFSQFYRQNAKISYNEIEFVRFIKNLVNNVHCFMLDRRERSFFVTVLSRYNIVNLRMLVNCSKQNILRFQHWDTFKKTERFDKVIKQANEHLQKYSTWLKNYQQQISRTIIYEIVELLPEANIQITQEIFFIDFKFYIKLFNLLRNFILTYILKQNSSISDQDEKLTYYLGIQQLLMIMKIFRFRTEKKNHLEGVGLKEKLVSRFNDKDQIEINEDILREREGQLKDLCSQHIVLEEVVNPLLKF